MSKEPGQLAWEAHEAHREWEDQTPWRILHPQNQADWARVEAAIRADERAKVIEECAKVVEARPPRFFDTPEVQHRQTVAAIRAKGAEHG